jgi:hypothetical protein
MQEDVHESIDCESLPITMERVSEIIPVERHEMMDGSVFVNYRSIVGTQNYRTFNKKFSLPNDGTCFIKNMFIVCEGNLFDCIDCIELELSNEIFVSINSEFMYRKMIETFGMQVETVNGFHMFPIPFNDTIVNNKIINGSVIIKCKSKKQLDGVSCIANYSKINEEMTANVIDFVKDIKFIYIKSSVETFQIFKGNNLIQNPFGLCSFKMSLFGYTGTITNIKMRHVSKTNDYYVDDSNNAITYNDDSIDIDFDKEEHNIYKKKVITFNKYKSVIELESSDDCEISIICYQYNVYDCSNLIYKTLFRSCL